jgi:sec-independent protein translocase protein TatA
LRGKSRFACLGRALMWTYRASWLPWYNDRCEKAMFGSVGPTEIILIFIIALLVFGPRKLPEIGKSVGKAIREFKKASDEIKGRIEEEIQASEIKDVQKDLRDGMNSLRDGIQGIADASGVTDLKNEIKGIAGPGTAPAVPPKTENAAKDEAQHETGEGSKISG